MPLRRDPLGPINPQQIPSRVHGLRSSQSKLPRLAKSTVTQSTGNKNNSDASHMQTQTRGSKSRLTEKGREYQLQIEHDKALRERRRQRNEAKEQQAQGVPSERQIQAKIRELRAAGHSQEEIDEFLADPEADDEEQWEDEPGNEEDPNSDSEGPLLPREFTYQQTYQARTRTPFTLRPSLDPKIASSPGPPRPIPTSKNLQRQSSPGPRECDPKCRSPGPQHTHNTPNLPERPKKCNLPADETASEDDVSSDDTMPAHSHKRLRRQPAAGRPKAHDYEGLELSVLKAAQDEFQVRVCTQNAFPDEEATEQWALECWENACKRKDTQSFELTERLRKLIIERHSTIRGRVKDKVVLKLVAFYGFKHGSQDDIIEHNKQLAARLLDEDGYVYIDVEQSRGIYDHPILQEVINDQWFNDKKSDGISFGASFNPIPDATIALVFTAVEFGISRWSSGVYIKKGLFSEAAYHEVYERHLSGLEAFRNHSAKCAKGLARIKQRLHDFGRSNARVPNMRDTTKPRFNTAKFARAEAALEELED